MLMLANYYVDNDATVRETAKHYGMAKSTVHRMISSDRLFEINKRLYNKCLKIRTKHRLESCKRMQKANKLKNAKKKK
jgi:putative DeoR family transcriptional regulator (stage III sporulation protein D)